MRHVKKLLIFLAIVLIGVCAALPFRKQLLRNDADKSQAKKTDAVEWRGPPKDVLPLQVPTEPAPARSAESRKATAQTEPATAVQEVVATVRQAQAPGQTFGQPPRVQFGAPDVSEHASSQTTPPTKNELVPVDQLARAPARLAKAVDSEGPFIRHKIKDGDTLAGLAEKFLGNPARSDEIYQINGELLRFGPGVLPIGEELLIPAQ